MASSGAFQDSRSPDHYSWCPRKAKDALALWFGAGANEPVKSRELQAAGGSHPLSP